MNLNKLIEHLEDIRIQYPELGEDEVEISDEDGIYMSKVITTDIAAGPWIIVETQEKE